MLFDVSLPRGLPAAAVVGMVLSLAACGSAPRAPSRPAEVTSATRTGEPPAASASASAPGAAVAPQAEAPPAKLEERTTAAEPTPPAPPAAPPYGSAVAARFAEPSVRYQTPGLAEGRTDFTRQDELQGFMRELVGDPAAPGAGRPELLEYGTSQAGVSLQALRFSRPSADGTPRPLVLIVGGQHGDEPASCEALMVVARDLTGGKLASLLSRVDVVVVPRANPDGASMHQAGALDGTDIATDHLLLRTPEARALAALVRDNRPSVVVDAEEYEAAGPFMAKFDAAPRFDLLMQYAMTANLPAFITRASDEWFRRPMLAALQKERLSAEWYYTTSADTADRVVSMGGVQPDTLRNVSGLKNAVGVLIASRGKGIGRLDLQRRVHAQVTAITSVLQSTTGRAADLAKLRHFVEAETRASACQRDAVLLAEPTRSEYDLMALDLRTGADKPLSVDWNSSLTLQTTKSRSRPCGYWISADAPDVIERLHALGLTVQQISGNASVRGQGYRETSRGMAKRGDGGERVAVKIELIDAVLDMPDGSYYVPLTQPLAQLAVAALEPDTPNSYVANGVLPGADRVARALAIPQAALNDLP